MTNTRKVVIDQASLTFAELADIEEQLGRSLSSLFETSQARGMAALVWITIRRTDPMFTYEQALQLGPSNIENLEVDPDPEGPGANGGATLLSSAVSGGSAPTT